MDKLIARVEELEAKSKRDSETIAKLEKALTEADANLKSSISRFALFSPHFFFGR